MATAAKKPCSTCQKAAGILTCHGCGKCFCYRHVAEHRQELNKQMDELTTEHDKLRQTMADQQAEPTCHPLMTKIDVWEKQSIEKVRQTAIKARKQVLTIIDERRIRVTENLTSLTNELNTARHEDNYVETDLKEWVGKLEVLKTDLSAPKTINFSSHDEENSLIPMIYINDSSTVIFSYSIGDVRLSEARRVVTHGPTFGIPEVRCRGDFSSGQHRVSFKIEQLSSYRAFACGIVSKTTPIGTIFTDPINYTITQNIHPLTYTPYQNIYPVNYTTNQNIHPNLTNHYKFNHNVVSCFTENNVAFQLGEEYEFSIDCDMKNICIRNRLLGERSNSNIDTTKYPLPWQFFIALFYPNDCVRLC